MTSVAPLPVPDGDTQAYWNGVAEQRLLVPRCGACGRWIWLPRPLCPTCHQPDPAWTEVTGEGSLLSWTVIHPPVLPVWADEVPFPVGLVELVEGVRMVGRVVDAAERDLVVGQPMVLRWRSEGAQPLPTWRPRVQEAPQQAVATT